MIELLPIENEAHWSEVDRIQRLAYSEALLEDLQALKEKARISGHFCSLLRDTAASETIGYVLAHPYTKHQIPPLNSSDLLLPSPQEDNVFLHDMALAPACAGKGVGKDAVNLLITKVRASGYKSMSLVAVQSSSEFWNKVAGFECIPAPDPKALQKYGAGAKTMHLKL